MRRKSICWVEILGESSLTSSALPVGRGATAAPLPQMVGVGFVDAHREGRRYIVHSDELLSAMRGSGPFPVKRGIELDAMYELKFCQE